MEIFMALLVSMLAFDGPSLPAGQDAYERPSLLVEPADLVKALSGDGLVVLDARNREEFEKARVPSARWVDAAAWAKGFGKGDDAKEWSRRIGELGIGARSRVVVYDNVHFRDAARVWWILRYWGLEGAALLNGNWAGWIAGGFPIEEGTPKPSAAAEFEAKAQRKRLSTKSALLDSLKSGRKLQIVDARSEAEYCGTDGQKNRRPGAIPGAVHLEWIDLIDKPTQRFKAAKELRKLMEEAGIDPKKPVVTHCQSGGRASVMVFALELLGSDGAANYYASWAEWGKADDTPVVPGKPREKK